MKKGDLSPDDVLSELETIIHQHLAAAKQATTLLTDVAAHEIRTRLLNICESIHAQWQHAVYTGKKSAAKAHVRHSHARLLTMVGALGNYTEPSRLQMRQAHEPLAALLYDAAQCLQELLAFLRHHFLHYLNLNAWVPAPYGLVVYAALARQWFPLYKAFAARGVDRTLLNLVHGPVLQWKRHHYRQIPYHEVLYAQRLLTACEEIVKDPAHTDIDKAFQKMLLSLNFYTRPYHAYCEHWIIQHENAAGLNIQHKIDHLDQLRTHIATLYKDPEALRYIASDVPIIATQMERWITERIAYWERNLARWKTTPAENPACRGSIKLNVTVKQLGCLLYLLEHIGLITANTKKEVLDTLAPFIQTKGKTIPTVNSLQKSVTTSAMELATLEKVDQWLLNMTGCVQGLIKVAKQKEAVPLPYTTQ